MSSSINSHLSAKQAALMKQNEEINAKVEEIGQKTSTSATSSRHLVASSLTIESSALATTSTANLNGPGSSDSASNSVNSSPSGMRRVSRARLRERVTTDADETSQSVEHNARSKSSSSSMRKSQPRIHSEGRRTRERTTSSSKKKHSDSEEEPVNAGDQPEPLLENIDPYSSEIPEGLGAEATIRYQKARLRVLQDELDAAHNQLQTALANNTTLTSKVEDLTRDNEEIAKKLQQTTQLMEKHRELVSAQEDKQQVLESQLATSQQRMEELERNEKLTTQQFRSKDVRLNRALEELEKVKAQLQEERSLKTDQLVPKAELENLQRENKKLVKQKNELLVAFKKQIKLIDILKRQRIHMEAAKMLSFTEEEFSRALELGPS